LQTTKYHTQTSDQGGRWGITHCSGEQKHGACGGKKPWCFCSYIRRTWCWCKPDVVETFCSKKKPWSKCRYTQHAACDSVCGWR